MKLLIKNGQVIDPASSFEGKADILVEDGKIARVAENIAANGTPFIEAAGKVVLPGLVDMHVHLREPGREDKETIATGTKAAVKGGVTSVLAMPNTTPPMDEEKHVLRAMEMIKKTAHCNVFVSGCLTAGRMGRELADYTALKNAGVVALTDDGSSVDDEALSFEAFKNAAALGLPVICHSEDAHLSAKGVVNLGLISTGLGLRGISAESEYKRVERDIALAHKAGCPVHIAHVSCKESIDLIAQAKRKGHKVTAETAPHYLIFTEDDLVGYDTNFKMKPPLRSKADREALRKALKDGVIDAIASDHAPHTESEKDIEFDHAEFGVTGLETELSAVAMELVETGLLSWMDTSRLMSFSPARILNIDRGTLKQGAWADITIFDPKKEWVVTKAGFASMSNNSPFLGRTMRGAVSCCLVAGKAVYGSREVNSASLKRFHV